MIRYVELRWGNAFSYGDNNVLLLDVDPLTQLVGLNGHGKSSIAILLEEVQFNTNSKKIKKGDILNRYIKATKYWIELDFVKDGNNYTIKTVRGTTSTVVLLCNDEDISSHTPTGTYKQIEYILGYDHKTFSQIVYQSSASSLQFLSDTDTARKKFLIDLLNLTSYTKSADLFKALASDLNKTVEATSTKVNTTKSWISKYDNEDLAIRELEVVPEPLTDKIEKIAVLKHSIDSIKSTNIKIAQNNTYRELLESATLPEKMVDAPSGSIVFMQSELAVKQKALKDGIALSKKCSGPTTTCPTCSQSMDNSVMFGIVKEFTITKNTLEDEIQELTTKINAYNTQLKSHKVTSDQLANWEKYHSLVDSSLPSTLLDKAEIDAEIAQLTLEVQTRAKEIESIRKRNTLITEHNSKAKVIGSQMVEMKNELKVLSDTLVESMEELVKLQILVKAFSTTGLVAYKIECLVKDLELLTNKYLGILAAGRFQLSFKIASADKLNVVITDNGNDISIESLSSGEKARVNVATLLAIRQLMQTLSNSRTNLLILDETIENLDAEGKEKLVEILLSETSLNTFLISHGFSHPLLEKINVIKENNISRVE